MSREPPNPFEPIYPLLELQDLTDRAADLQRRLDEALAVLADVREERGLSAFREWLVGILQDRERNTVEGPLPPDPYNRGEEVAFGIVLYEFDRRFGGGK